VPLYFLDTSALVKLYVQEPGTERLLSVVNARQADRFAILSVASVEARSAIRRRERAGDMDAQSADLVLDALRADIETMFITQGVTESLIDLASVMVDRHGLRAYDAMQLAGSLMVGATEPHGSIFVCSDRQLLNAAQSERCRIFDPVEE
jgi:uncharacterized protein